MAEGAGSGDEYSNDYPCCDLQGPWEMSRSSATGVDANPWGVQAGRAQRKLSPRGFCRDIHEST